ncbi:hypothetical protein HMPREF1981_00190 [Bacteroides pyogenes F0041]|uniref:DUF1573 domain-containing protein n=1 Tax=Bacteroides pyogenes F0041 TaxID=1321819 RepID=U2CEF0_9BACE|nr:DUF1573 domain-containing protein [Bacteroides pyogenes]ERI88874.1 hypothetical protein HMPREF1981_00190 [Bacteroides pyogenes F0041]MBB3894783.1 hypothetical protein [Bacteroides pyogenes]GAE21152.1 hypothetical protein JCM10003_561 [Bacteroides pyogenes JCM 10003]SUV35216.1 Protein of uncharacterised function (DUF1573) [Bacteroides pyogenes]
MKINIKNLGRLLFLLLSLTACSPSKNDKTTIEIKDNYRHYYPIQAGQQLDIMFEIRNTGKKTLVLSDILTSCGCVVVKKSSVNTIPAGKTGHLILQYDSSKNIGYVKHYITLYGNFTNTHIKEVVFDVNVVPNALYTKDYEELHQEKKSKKGNTESLVDGDASQKGYYMDSDLL